MERTGIWNIPTHYLTWYLCLRMDENNELCLICFEDCDERIATCACGYIHQKCIEDMYALQCPICRNVWVDQIVRRTRLSTDGLMGIFARPTYWPRLEHPSTRIASRADTQLLIRKLLESLILMPVPYVYKKDKGHHTVTCLCEEVWYIDRNSYGRIRYVKVNNGVFYFQMTHPNEFKRALVIFRNTRRAVPDPDIGISL